MSHRRSIYLMWNIPFIWLVKVGIAKNVRVRRGNISKSMPGNAVVLFSMKVPAARQLESFIHALCWMFSARWFGSGKSEWFFFPAALIAIPVMILAAFIEITLICCAVLLLLKFNSLI